MLKSVSHPARVRLLTLLLQGEHEFYKLLQSTDLSKTALANHLDQLVERKLVERVSRGQYELTASGTELVRAVAKLYTDSILREEAQEKSLSARYSEGFSSKRKTIGKKVEHLPCWLSYNGAMAASLQSLGVSADTIDVGGYSGYAFLVNVSREMISPTGPTALSPKAWEQIIKGTESLGWTLERHKYPRSYPLKEGKPTPEEIEVARKLFERIRKEIDERDGPVVLWGVFVPVYGVVNGYDGDSYITTEIKEGAIIERLLPFHALQAPGHIDAFFFRNRVIVNCREARVAALKRALDFASARIPVVDGYVAGPDAFKEWAHTLKYARKGDQDYMGNSYVGECVYEGRNVCGEFLTRLADKSRSRGSNSLRQAAQIYSKSRAFMKEFTELFPFKYQGKMSLSDRKKGAEILETVAVLEDEAISKMEKTLESLAPAG